MRFTLEWQSAISITMNCQYKSHQILCEEPCKRCNRARGLKMCRSCGQVLVLALAFRLKQATCRDCEKKEKGPTKMGRPKIFSQEKAFKLLSQGATTSELMKALKCSQPTAWRLAEAWKEAILLSPHEGSS